MNLHSPHPINMQSSFTISTTPYSNNIKSDLQDRTRKIYKYNRITRQGI